MKTKWIANDKYQAAEIICRVVRIQYFSFPVFLQARDRSFFRCARFFRILYILVEYEASDFTSFCTMRTSLSSYLL